MPNTDDTTPGSKPTLNPPSERAAKDAEAIARLERELEWEKDRRKEERFFAIVIGLILINILLLKDSPSEMLPIAIVLL